VRHLAHGEVQSILDHIREKDQFKKGERMNFVRVLFVLLALSLCVTTPSEAGEVNLPDSLFIPEQSQAGATHLLDIEIERTVQETKVHLIANGSITDYHEARLKKNVKANRPDRMYLDLNNLRFAGQSPAKEVGTALARIRTGRRSNGVRVVFDSNLDGLFDYTISEQPDGLLVTIREPSAAPAVVADIMPESESETGPEEAIAPIVETIYPQPKAAGDLDLVIATSDSPDYVREWLKISADRNMGLELLKSAKADQDITTSFLVTGLTPDSDGNFSYEISFTLLDPSGNLMENHRNYARAAGKAPTYPVFIMAKPELALVLDSSDPVGDYTLIGIVQDLINNKVFRGSMRITLRR